MLGLTWSSKLEVGIAKIDDQHRQLIDIANRVVEAVRERLGSLGVDEIVKELRDYTVVHFREEEEYMEQVQYPERGAHHVEHERLKQQVKHWQHDLFIQEKVTVDEVLEFMRGWLLDHILHSDVAFKDWMAENATCTLKEGRKPETRCQKK